MGSGVLRVSELGWVLGGGGVCGIKKVCTFFVHK